MRGLEERWVRGSSIMAMWNGRHRCRVHSFGGLDMPEIVLRYCRMRSESAQDERFSFMSLRLRCAPAYGSEVVFSGAVYPALIPHRWRASGTDGARLCRAC